MEALAVEARPPRWFDRVDRRITEWMAAHGLTLLRFALGIVFFWFGALKLFPGVSPAETLAGRTIEALDAGRGPDRGRAADPGGLGDDHRPRACSSAAGCG